MREALTKEALIWESFKAQNTLNPSFLRDLVAGLQFEARDIAHPHRPSLTVPALVHTGAFVASMGPVDELGRPLPVSPLAMFLFNRSGGDLYAPDNRFSLDQRGPHATVTEAEVASLTRNYQDLAVRITIVDQAVFKADYAYDALGNGSTVTLQTAVGL